MFPEIDYAIINKAIAKLGQVTERSLRVIITRNAIFKEFSISKMQILISERKEAIKKQEEIKQEAEKKLKDLKERRMKMRKEKEKKSLNNKKNIKKEERKERKEERKEEKEEEKIKEKTENNIKENKIVIKKDKHVNYWIEHSMEGSKVYDQETESFRRVLLGYHVSFCMNSIYVEHNPERCISHHDNDEIRRRPLYYKGEWNYYPILCKNKDKCNDKKECVYSHNYTEINFHPLCYKTTLCDFNEEECRKKYCDKAHAKNDLRDIVLLYYTDNRSSALSPLTFKGNIFDIKTYKTEGCEKPECKNNQCVYYHNDLERRRNPSDYNYEPKLCPYIYKKEYLPPDNCPKKDKCTLCNTKNEYKYHPVNYKTKLCNRDPCTYGSYCSDIHESDIEKLTKELNDLQVKAKEIRKIEKNWRCSFCKEVVRSVKDAAILLCCKYMVCKECLENDLVCLKCKKEIKVATYFDNSQIENNN